MPVACRDHLSVVQSVNLEGLFGVQPLRLQDLSPQRCGIGFPADTVEVTYRGVAGAAHPIEGRLPRRGVSRRLDLDQLPVTLLLAGVVD